MRSRLNRGLVALFAVALLMTFALSWPVSAQRSMTILDYYLSMPRQYLRHAGGDTEAARSAALYVSDVENGYLQARQPNGEFYSALALFKQADGTDLIAVENRECARGCNEEFFLLSYRDGRWADVTKKLLPAMDEDEVTAALGTRLKAREGFRPRVLHRLSGGSGAPIEVSEYWSGVRLGQLEWVGGEFVFKPFSTSSAHASRRVLASAGNAEGDRLEIIAVEPELSTRLPLQGRLNVRIAYELRSARACRIYLRPVVLEERLPDEFTHGSMLYLQGAGELSTWFGFDNQAHLQRLKVEMLDEQKKTLVALNYNTEADWEGTLECPAFHVECFPDGMNANAPIACMAYPVGVQRDQKLTYEWELSAGTIITGQGTRRITLNANDVTEKNLTARVKVGGLAPTCATTAFDTVPLADAGKAPQ